MNKDFTLNKLIRFIYKETSALEHLEIEHAIDEDEVLKQSYLDLLNGYKRFPKVKFFPSKTTMNNILAYSQNVSLNPA